MPATARASSNAPLRQPATIQVAGMARSHLGEPAPLAWFPYSACGAAR